MKRYTLLAFFLSALTLTAQTVTETRQRSLGKWGISPAGYSGITSLGNNRYALASDKERTDGFYIFRIEQNAENGRIENVVSEGFYGNPSPLTDSRGITVRDCEGVAYYPKANTLFISGEGDQKILEYNMDGRPTGRELNVPAKYSVTSIVPNYGFEALCYDSVHTLFWTTTESTLPYDGAAVGRLHPDAQNLLRIQAFNTDFQPVAQYAYRMDRRSVSKLGSTYVMGVPTITSLSDGRLLVLEREANVKGKGLGSTVRCKLFVVNPHESHQTDFSVSLQDIDPNTFMIKTLLADWQTKVKPWKIGFANYEGMCLGRQLADGRQTILLISDSQGGYHKGPFRLKDYIKVLILEK